MSDYVISLIRTVVPMAVGWLATVLIGAGIEFDTVALEAALVSLISAAWYALTRWLETRYPRFGWLLGYPSSPAYQPRHSGG